LDTDSIASAVASGLLILGTPFTLGGAIRRDINAKMMQLSIANINEINLSFYENNSCQFIFCDLLSSRSRDTTAKQKLSCCVFIAIKPVQR
jgi:hypothetical protein